MKKAILSLAAFGILCGMLLGCSPGQTPAQAAYTSNPAIETFIAATPAPSAAGTLETTLSPSQTEAGKRAKYVFLFIGDGMGEAQVTLARILARRQPGAEDVGFGELAFTDFESYGAIDTFDAASYCPDSASAGTALATGNKTVDGVIAMDPGKAVAFKSVAKYAGEAGFKVGIVTSVPLNHATPACFYANQDDRDKFYDIALQLVHSDFDFFAGGGFLQPAGPDGKRENILELAKKAGYKIADRVSDLASFNSASGKVIALAPDGQKDKDQSLLYEIDRRKMAGNGQPCLALADYVRAGIAVLDNANGFFMLCEGGKIDWACHANNGEAAAWEVMAFSDAVREAAEFAARHPDETLIVVTGDHETGGLIIRYAGTPVKDINSGLGWAAKSHTGVPVPIYARGACADLFSGSYDNTQVFFKLIDAMGLAQVPAG